MKPKYNKLMNEIEKKKTKKAENNYVGRRKELANSRKRSELSRWRVVYWWKIIRATCARKSETRRVPMMRSKNRITNSSKHVSNTSNVSNLSL